MTEKKEMHPAWFFIGNKGKLSLWARCKNCGKWNVIREGSDIQNLSPLPKEPIKEPCKNCKKEIIVEKVWFARKGMKQPKDC